MTDDETLPPDPPSTGRDTDQPTLPHRPVDETTSSQGHDPSDAPTFVGSSAKTIPVNRGLEEAGYQVLEELGRGGMGVVYKARDTKLERTVAIKMILAGQFASADEIQRFRLEGEAAARLDHPGIVPVYEVGEADGNHFFSMKFIQGGSLAEFMEDFQGDHRELVTLLIKVARAVQHAHQRGVLHRDLKPANILVTEKSEPVVTDLGLAKRMDAESGLTQTGFAMGTPGFMAPEQAEGRKDITTAADVFSLGAILYWLLTGTAPFQGESPMQVVMATIKEDVPSLLKAKPTAGRDLDLICQKAMAKDSLERYSSAGAFADDLQAWLDGELLSVSAPTAVSVASLWIRKNIRSVLASCSTGFLCGLLVGGLFLVGQLRSLGFEHHALEVLRDAKPSWASMTTGLRHLSGGFAGALEFFTIPVVAVCAFLNVWFVRPTTRDGNIVSAATAGLLAGVIAFVTSVGWPAISGDVIARGANDIQLVSNAMWLESEAETNLAKQALVQRYPGITDIDERYRGDYIARKIAHDQETGIMPGLWAAIFRAALWVAIPLGVSSVLSGQLWRSGVRGGLWFGLTWERAAYVYLLAILIWVWCQPVHMSAPFMTLAALVLIASLAMAVRRWYVAARVAAAFATVVVFLLLLRDVARFNNTYANVGKAKSHEQIIDAISYNDLYLEQREDQRRRFQSAICWLYLKNESKYQLHCEKMYGAFENAYRPEVASRIAKVCLLRPDLQPTENMQTLHSMAELASNFETSNLHVWFCMTRAISDVRKGDYGAALDWNARCRDKNEDYGGVYLTDTTYLVDALALMGLNKNDKAMKAWQQAQEKFASSQEYVSSYPSDRWWENRMVYQILAEEVKQELKPE